MPTSSDPISCNHGALVSCSCGPELLRGTRADAGDEAQRRAAIEAARQRVASVGQWGPWQSLGRRFGVACVALEVTQRCNLDCAFCYLSTSSQALHDIPLPEVYRRIDMIRGTYGPGVDVQITGGEPTLRSLEDLEAIVRYIHSAGLRSTLMTNGIRASRALLQGLASAGLSDVAFHVDLTQARKGHDSEAALDAIRLAYIERVRGLGLSVMFNTTLDERNFPELPARVRFFITHADVVRFASFQIGAHTGRGVGVAPRNFGIADVEAAIAGAAATALRFDAVGSGHRRCNRYACALVINGQVHDAFDNIAITQAVLDATALRPLDRRRPWRALRSLLVGTLAHPALWMSAVPWALRKIWSARRDLLAARGRVSKLSFFVHAFMPADGLDAERITACSFMVMTPRGPLSMCEHNAKRDEHLLVPARITQGQRLVYWDPSNGKTSRGRPAMVSVQLNQRTARGVARLNTPR